MRAQLLARLAERASLMWTDAATHMDLLIELLIGTTAAGLCILVGAGLANIKRAARGDQLPHFVIAFGGRRPHRRGGAGAGARRGSTTSPTRSPRSARCCWAAHRSWRSTATRPSASDPCRSSSPWARTSCRNPSPSAASSPRTAGGAVLLAVLIGLQNLPEGFNAWRELAAANFRATKALGLLVVLVLLGPVCGVIGLVLARRPRRDPRRHHAVRCRRASFI